MEEIIKAIQQNDGQNIKLTNLIIFMDKYQDILLEIHEECEELRTSALIEVKPLAKLLSDNLVPMHEQRDKLATWQHIDTYKSLMEA